MGRIREVTLALPVMSAYAPLDPHYRGWFELRVDEAELAALRAMAPFLAKHPQIRSMELGARGCSMPAITNAAEAYQPRDCEISVSCGGGDSACRLKARSRFMDGVPVESCTTWLDDVQALYGEATWYAENGGQNRGLHPYPAMLARWTAAAHGQFVSRYPSAAGFWAQIKEAA